MLSYKNTYDMVNSDGGIILKLSTTRKFNICCAVAGADGFP